MPNRKEEVAARVRTCIECSEALRGPEDDGGATVGASGGGNGGGDGGGDGEDVRETPAFAAPTAGNAEAVSLETRLLAEGGAERGGSGALCALDVGAVNSLC